MWTEQKKHYRRHRFRNGILAKLFLDYGNTVFGVEPNQAMREAAEVYLAQYYDFHSMLGTAEATHLDPSSIDFITVGTAFHWFAVEKPNTNLNVLPDLILGLS